MFRKKLVIIGDGACGKTSLLLAYQNSNKKCFDEPEPTILNTNTIKINLNDKIEIEFMVWDTAGQEEYEKLRPITYKDSDIIILCYSIDNPDSYSNIIEKWYPELRYYCPTVPVILVGNKKDLRDQKNESDRMKQDLNFSNLSSLVFIDSIQGDNLCKRIKANHFLECSVRTGENVKEVFDYAALIAEMNSKLIKENKKINKTGCFKFCFNEKCEIM